MTAKISILLLLLTVGCKESAKIHYNIYSSYGNHTNITITMRSNSSVSFRTQEGKRMIMYGTFAIVEEENDSKD